jgi:transposase
VALKPVDQMPVEVIESRLKRLKRKMKSCKDSRMQERYQTIYLYLQGYSKEEIAKITGRALSTVYRYINLYLNSGLKSLRMKHSPGRPNFLTEEQKEKVYDVVARRVPKDVGFPVEMNWTAPLLRAWIEHEFGIKYSNRGALQLLHSLGFSCTRPTYTLAKADAKRQEEF